MSENPVLAVALEILLMSTLTLAFNIQPVRLEPVTITVVGPWSGVERDAFLSILQVFENKTGINVDYRVSRAEELATILPQHFANGTAPGDIIFMWPWFIKDNGQEGHIRDVTDLVDEANFSIGALDPVQDICRLYGGAYTGKVNPGFWFRKSFFAANNLTEPTTWAEFLTLLDDIAAIPGIANPIASGDGVGWPLSDVVEQFLATFGGPELHRNLTAGTVEWNSTGVRTIFADKLVPLLQGNFSSPIEWTTAMDLWWQGDYGLYFMGSWITLMVDNATDLGVFTLPGAEGLVFYSDYFFIPTYTDYPDEAAQLFQFLAGTEAQALQVAQGGHIAANLGVPLGAYSPVYRMVANLTYGKEFLFDLDNMVGGVFQTVFWDQLKLLWVNPTTLDDVLEAIQAVAPSRPPLDTTPPAILILSPENRTYPTTSIPLNFTTSECTSWTGYSLDGQGNVTVVDDATLFSLPDGPHYVGVCANDTLGNMGASSVVCFTVDTTPPDITNISQIPPQDVLPSDEVKVNATVNDALSEVKRVILNYTTNNGTWFSVAGTNLEGDIWNAIIPMFPYDTTVTYVIAAEDNVGNVITTAELGYGLQYSVIPEFPSLFLPTLLMMAALLAFTVNRRKRKCVIIN